MIYFEQQALSHVLILITNNEISRDMKRKIHRKYMLRLSSTKQLVLVLVHLLEQDPMVLCRLQVVEALSMR